MLSHRQLAHLLIILKNDSFQGIEHWLPEVVQIDGDIGENMRDPNSDRTHRRLLTSRPDRGDGDSELLDPSASPRFVASLLRNRRSHDHELEWQHEYGPAMIK